MIAKIGSLGIVRVIVLCLVVNAFVGFTGCASVEGLVDLEGGEGARSAQVEPIVVLAGTPNVKFSIARFLGNDFKKKYVYSELEVKVDIAGISYKLEGGDPWEYSSPSGFDFTETGDIVLSLGSKELLRLPKIFRIIDTFKVTLTFDDGPSIDKAALGAGVSRSPTILTLDALDLFVHGDEGNKQGVKAAFFVLTTADSFMKIVYPKAESQQGRDVLREVGRRGHVVGVHWGGEYKKQSLGHNRRVLMPAYEVSGNNTHVFANALECDLYECVETIKRVTDQTPAFVRPPLWRYKDKNNPSVEASIKNVYDKFGLKMILTDAKFPDGGYYLISMVAVQKYVAFRNNLQRAFKSGQDNLIISMHDSNKYTASILGNILKMIQVEFEKVDFSGAIGNSGRRLDFADTAYEVRRNLQAKERYTMFPTYKGGDSY